MLTKSIKRKPLPRWFVVVQFAKAQANLAAPREIVSTEIFMTFAENSAVAVNAIRNYVGEKQFRAEQWIENRKGKKRFLDYTICGVIEGVRIEGADLIVVDCARLEEEKEKK